MQPRSAAGSPDVLDAFAQSAGRALACAFSSSDEYEAAVIAERRAEGRYGSRYRPPLALIYGVGAAILAIVFFFV
jgi:hypothetical protein